GFLVMIFSLSLTVFTLPLATLYMWHRHNFSPPFQNSALKSALLKLVLPFAIDESAWMIRNYLELGFFFSIG
ncbi:MAG: hypothetical protein NZ933_07070, partial [Bacteroidia bacterium]|nr:hypothetical protein [Bacteroidia bacterium]